MHALWSWLSCNAAAIQAVASCVIIVLTAITIVVLIATWRAARAQANAADKLTMSTDKQIDILKEQVTATRRQIEESVRPMLDVPVGFIAGASLLTGKVMNLGNGPALDITYAYGKFGDREIHEEFVVPPTVSKDKGFDMTIDPDKIRKTGLIFIYRSLSGTDCASSLTSQRPHFHYHPDVHEWVQSLRTPRS